MLDFIGGFGICARATFSRALEVAIRDRDLLL
jgi:hypothetical protein